MVYLIVKCNVGADAGELMSSSLTDTKTAECLSVEIGQICCLLSNKIVVAHQVHQPY